MDGAGVRGVQDGGLFAHGPGLKSGTDNPNETMHLHMAVVCILKCTVLLPEESVLGGAAVGHCQWQCSLTERGAHMRAIWESED